jgi:precorrin-6B methylase 2
MKKDRKQDDIYLHTQHIFRGQEQLLNDEARNRAFYRALQRHVRPGSSVLDIGSGTGVWSAAAALLGAGRVVAVERDDLLIPVIRNLIKENGVADKVEVIHGDSRQVRLDERFDLVVSETIGNQAFEEQIAPIMADARKRLLKPGGVLIPGAISLVAAAAHFKNPLKQSPAGLPIKCGYFESLNLNVPVMLNDRSRLNIVTSPKELARVDLGRADGPPDLSNLTALWKNADAARINCFAVWAEVSLARGVKLSTLETTSWSPVVYLIRPFKQSRGNVELTLNMTERSHYWTAALSGKRDKESQSYSPVFAYTSLITHLRMAEANAFASRRK